MDDNTQNLLAVAAAAATTAHGAASRVEAAARIGNFADLDARIEVAWALLLDAEARTSAALRAARAGTALGRPARDEAQLAAIGAAEALSAWCAAARQRVCVVADQMYFG